MSVPPIGLSSTYADQLEGTWLPYDPPGFPDPELLLLNEPLLDGLGLDAEVVRAHAAGIFSGSAVPSDARPIALAYAGHQFGHFAGVLGDGRACLLGEVVGPDGVRRDVQLKGSGPTPFSRGGDGRATLGPVLREYLVGEAMHALGIPTTRALAVVTTGDRVRRDGWLPGAVLTRVAASHLRVGTMELFAARREPDRVEALVRYALARHYPGGRTAADLLVSVAEAQARLVARWMHVGFVHGVMNTDNTALSGETIDYGPCAFMDRHDPATVFSSIDHHGRYAYGNQPHIGMWNLARLAEAVIVQLGDSPTEATDVAKGALARYADVHQEAWLAGMRDKLGLADAQDGDQALVDDLLAWMTADGMDHTSTFRTLARTLDGAPLPWCGERFGAWHARWTTRLGSRPAVEVARAMDAVNPVYVPRNHLVEEALSAAHQGDMGPFATLLERVVRPFEEVDGAGRFAEPGPESAAPYRTFCGT
ncbi:MAG: YdiU family protein [Alphaproteobacteria bacterium]|nr:YdiU family protein [Alphaproteobacteria bacterium]